MDAVFFISFGGPEKPEDIRPFLEIVTRGRRIPPERIDEVAHHYEVIGGASPINAITNRQAEGLRAALGDIPVYVGNRNWHPFIEDTLRKMAADGIQSVVGFVTAAYRCEASWDRYLNAVETARQKIGPSAPTISYVAPWFDHPLFIQAICGRVTEVFLEDGAVCVSRFDSSPSEPIGSRRMMGEGRMNDIPWIFTAHSIPTAMAAASRYVQELQTTAGLVGARFGVENWKIAYTSRSGVPTDPWLEPDVCDEIRSQSVHPCKNVFVIPIGFVADHVEVLFDLDVEAQAAARSCGVTLKRAQTVGDHPLFIQMMADVIREMASAKPT